LRAFIEVEKPVTLYTKHLRTSLNATLFLAIFISIFFNPNPGFALGNGEASLPSFTEFSKSVQNNEANVLRGVYIPDVLAFPVVQQPMFRMASQFGNVGLLAHNNLSGKFFSQLAVGQDVRLVYGDGKVEYFVITKVLQYQALQPTNPYSSFRDLSNNEILTAEQMFNEVYRGNRHVTFQTCIEANGDLSWGRLFVIAVPRPHYSGFNHFDLH
jgi:hypothetical protein